MINVTTSIDGRVHAVTCEFRAVGCHDMDHVASLFPDQQPGIRS